MPLKTGESEDYVLALKQELRETVKRMPYFVETPEKKKNKRSSKEQRELALKEKKSYFVLALPVLAHWTLS